MNFLLQKYHFVMKNSINWNLKLSTFLYLYEYTELIFLEETESVLKWPPLLSPPIIDNEKTSRVFAL